MCQNSSGSRSCPKGLWWVCADVHSHGPLHRACHLIQMGPPSTGKVPQIPAAPHYPAAYMLWSRLEPNTSVRRSRCSESVLLCIISTKNTLQKPPRAPVQHFPNLGVPASPLGILLKCVVGIIVPISQTMDLRLWRVTCSKQWVCDKARVSRCPLPKPARFNVLHTVLYLPTLCYTWKHWIAQESRSPLWWLFIQVATFLLT